MELIVTMQCAQFLSAYGETGINHAAGRDLIEAFVRSGTEYPYRQIKALCLVNLCGILSNGLIPAKHNRGLFYFYVFCEVLQVECCSLKKIPEYF